MTQHTFFCIDGHTAGAPVRLVSGGAPPLKGENQTNGANTSWRITTGSAKA